MKKSSPRSAGAAAGELERAASCVWKAPRPTPLFVRSRGRPAAASATPAEGRRLHALPKLEPATTGARDRFFRASVQPCTRSGGRLGSKGQGFGLARGSVRLLERHRLRGQPRGRAGQRITSGCARVSRRLQKSASSVWSQELRCGRGRSEATAPSQSQGDLGLMVNGTARARKRARGRFRTFVVDGRCSFVRVAHVRRSRGAPEQPAWGSSGETFAARRVELRDPGAPETCRQHAAPEEKAGAARRSAGRSG